MSSIDRDAFMTPTPAKVCGLVSTHGMEAATARWWWMDDRTLASLAQAGRGAKGEVLQNASKRRSYSELDAAVCVEASYILGSGTRGERASGVGHNVTQGLFPRRGLDYVCISPEERGRASSIGSLANNGNAEAIAERDRRHAYELAVGQVLRAALALVPTQPATGRYRLPPVDDTLREALAGLCPRAIEAVFPDLAVVETAAPVPAEEAAPVEVPTPDPVPVPPIEVPIVTAIPPTDRAPQSNRRAPDNERIRLDHAAGEPLVAIAERYDMAPSSLYSHWRRLGLSGRGRMDGYVVASTASAPVAEVAPQESVASDVPVEPAAPETVAAPLQDSDYGAISPEQAVAEVAGIEARVPLDTHNLGRAVDLAALKGLTMDVAIGWIRADIHSVASARKIPDAEPAMTAAMADAIFSEILWADERGTRQ